jgi:hypothetical protein
MSQRWPGGVTPAPDLVAAWLVLDRVPVERVPWWAAEWLADDRDGPALRELAGLGANDSYIIRDLLPSALAQAGATMPGDRVMAASIWFAHVARLYIDGRVEERWVAHLIDDIVRASDFDHSVYGLPLGALYGIGDAWDGGWGPSEPELRTMIQAACHEQVEAHDREGTA